MFKDEEKNTPPKLSDNKNICNPDHDIEMQTEKHLISKRILCVRYASNFLEGVCMARGIQNE